MNDELLLEIFDTRLFEAFDRQLLARVIPDVERRELAPGERLFRHGEHADTLYLVVEGEIQLHEPAPEGETGRIARHAGRLAAVGVAAVSGNGVYRHDAVSRDGAVVIAFPKVAIDKLVTFHPDFKIDVLLSDGANPPGQKRAARADASRPASEIAGWLVTLIAPVLVLFASQEYDFSRNQSLFLSILTATVSMWIFGMVDIFVPSLFVVLAVLVLGLVPPAVALSGFASDGFFMAMSVLGLGALVVSSGLSYRFMLFLLRHTPRNQFFYNVNLALTGILFSPLLPSVNGRVALIAPFLQDMREALRSREGGNATNALATSAFMGASLFSPIFLSGKSVNFVIYGLLPVQLQNQFQWLNWLFAAALTGGVMLVLSAVAIAIQFRNHERLHLSAELLDTQLKLLGPLNLREWAAVFGIVLFGTGVVLSTLIRIEPPWIALTLLYALLLSGVLKPAEFRQKIDWPFLVFLGGIVGMVSSMRYLALDDWLASRFSWLGDYMVGNFELFILLLAGIVSLVRVVVPISATVVILATVFIPISVVAGVNPWLVGFLILLFGDLWYLPYQSSYYIQFKRMTSAGMYDERRLLIANGLSVAIKLVAIYASIPFWKYLGIM